MGQRKTRVPPITLVALAPLIMLPACSSTSTSPAPSTTPSTPSSSAAPTQHGAFGECLRQHGVTIAPVATAGPSPQQPLGPAPGPASTSGAAPAPPGVDQSTWDTAMQACASLTSAPPQPNG